MGCSFGTCPPAGCALSGPTECPGRLALRSAGGPAFPRRPRADLLCGRLDQCAREFWWVGSAPLCPRPRGRFFPLVTCLLPNSESKILNQRHCGGRDRGSRERSRFIGCTRTGAGAAGRGGYRWVATGGARASCDQGAGEGGTRAADEAACGQIARYVGETLGVRQGSDLDDAEHQAAGGSATEGGGGGGNCACARGEGAGADTAGGEESLEEQGRGAAGRCWG